MLYNYYEFKDGSAVFFIYDQDDFGNFKALAINDNPASLVIDLRIPKEQIELVAFPINKSVFTNLYNAFTTDFMVRLYSFEDINKLKKDDLKGKCFINKDETKLFRVEGIEYQDQTLLGILLSYNEFSECNLVDFEYHLDYLSFVRDYNPMEAQEFFEAWQDIASTTSYYLGD